MASTTGIWWIYNNNESPLRTITVVLHLNKAKNIIITDTPAKVPNPLYETSVSVTKESLFIHTFACIDVPSYLLLIIDNAVRGTLLIQVPHDTEKIITPIYRTINRNNIGSNQSLIMETNVTNKIISKVVKDTIGQIEGLISSLI